MATKAKKETKSKIKDSLKNVFINELKDKNEEERLERVKENANLKEVIIYTKFSCPYCKQVKEELKKEGINYTEKEQAEYQNEWSTIVSATNLPIFPTVVVNDNYLVPRRDFTNIPQCITQIKTLGHPDYINPSFEVKLIENIKTLQYNIGASFQNLNQQMGPLQKLVTLLQKELLDETPEESPKNKKSDNVDMEYEPGNLHDVQ